MDNTGLIQFRPYQREAFWSDLGLTFLLWRRQSGKSRTLGAKGLRRMMQIRGLSIFFVSAAIRLGMENIRKESELWMEMLAAFKKAASDSKMLLDTNAEGLDLDAVCDLFEHQKLETKLWHDQTSYSRSIVIAPNPDTAVGWTGDVVMDEVGRMPEFKEVMEAVGPIMSGSPQFVWTMASTPPPDDAHYSWELLVPPRDEFPVNPNGNWYRSQADIDVHRVDAWDAYAAGVPLYDRRTREPISPDEDRARAFDKAAWDRNYGLRFLSGGTAAVSFQAIHQAMALGKNLGVCAAISEEISA
jgi:hypothetical protein